MQNNVTELTQRLLRSLDNNYNVVDMPAVVEIISILEKVSITKELLETTRLGRYINELRKKTSNESLSKRAKELVKKWKNMLLPDNNGQIKSAYPTGQLTDLDKGRKRPARETPEHVSQAKRPKMNGQSTEFDFSDNSNCSFKDAIHVNKELRTNSGVIMINSDSNSSLPDALRQDPPLEQQLPKKRGRKKGSKNHRNLLDDAESSLASKLAVSSLCMSRGNSKVKTTQELIAGLQNKGSSSILSLPPLNSKPKEDLNERAAKLTERVSMIDQRLYTNSNRSKQKNRFTSSKPSIGERSDRVIESGSVINDKSLSNQTKAKEEEEEIIVVDDINASEKKEESEPSNEAPAEPEGPPPLSLEQIMAQLPPVDLSFLKEEDEEPSCSCILKENQSDFSVEEEPAETELEPSCKFEFVEDDKCPAKTFYADMYCLDSVDECRVKQLSEMCLPNVNGNPLVGSNDEVIDKDEHGLYVNVVPNVYSECKLKGDLPKENYKKYSISEGESSPEERTTGDSEYRGFAEWHECIERPSYNGETLKILPYVVID